MADGMSAGQLFAPERNRYFYGKLLGVAELDREQSYFNQKRWLLNRLMYGGGIVCGLDVAVDPMQPDMVVLSPGVALDAMGHEIVVPAPVHFNPRQLTDERGRPSGKPLEDGEVEVCLAYAEKATDLVPVLVADCDTPGHCAASTVHEGFHLLVRKTPGPPKPHGCELGEFPLPTDETLHEMLAKLINAQCPVPTAADSCVVLARVSIPLGGHPSVIPAVARQLVYSNSLLQQMIVCLADRLNLIVHGYYLRYLSGDGQIGTHDTDLPAPIAIELLDATNKRLENKPVKFEVTGGGGKVNGAQSVTINTNMSGVAEAKWTLGPPGSQEIKVSAAGSIFTVEFHATSV